MIQRFLYHAFWNFYDCMGTLVLGGVVHTLLALGIFAAGLSFNNEFLSTFSITAGIAVIQVILLSVVLSGLLPYCARAARGEPARWRHLLWGINGNLRVGAILGIWMIVLVVLSLNFFLYIKLQAQVSSAGFRLILITINSLIGWTLLVLCMLLAPWLCAATASEDKIKLIAVFKQGLIAAALLPGVWIFLSITGFLLLGIGAVIKVGVLLFVPVMASCSQTAYYLAMRQASFLMNAKEELGTGCPLRAYKRRANEIALQWEYRQPRRSLKELVRPWEY